MRRPEISAKSGGRAGGTLSGRPREWQETRIRKYVSSDRKGFRSENFVFGDKPVGDIAIGGGMSRALFQFELCE